MILAKMNYKPEMGPILGWGLDDHMKSLLAEEGQLFDQTPSAFIVFYANDAESFAAGLSFAQANSAAQAIVWVIYPKQTAKAYSSSINRDDIFRLAPAHGYTTVRQVAFDEELSALRLTRL